MDELKNQTEINNNRLRKTIEEMKIEILDGINDE